MGSIGNPVPVITPAYVNDGDKKKVKYELSPEMAKLLEQMEQGPDRHNKLIVISIAGAFRMGKSFLLNIILHYLQQEKPGSNWLGEPNDKFIVEGFPWRNGTEPETEGILMWSCLFEAHVNGETVFIMLLDTQGAFDLQHSVDECARIFALSTLMSSVQIFNVQNRLDAVALSYLRLFADFAGLFHKTQSAREKPFQALYFLIRDWQQHYEYNYGKEGGAEYLRKIVEGSNRNHTDESCGIAKSIFEAFEQVGCFLMPHPGKRVATDPKFDGYLKEIDEEFREKVQGFVEDLFADGNAPIKTVHGRPLTLANFRAVVQNYIQLLDGDSFPAIEDLHRCLSANNHLIVSDEAKRIYSKGIEESCQGKEFTLDNLKVMNSRYSRRALAYYDEATKIGTEEFGDRYRKRLEQDLDHLYNNYYQLMNEAIKQNDKQYWEFVKKGAIVGGGITLTLGAAGVGAAYAGTAVAAAAARAAPRVAAAAAPMMARAGPVIARAGQWVVSKALFRYNIMIMDPGGIGLACLPCQQLQ